MKAVLLCLTHYVGHQHTGDEPLPGMREFEVLSNPDCRGGFKVHKEMDRNG